MKETSLRIGSKSRHDVGRFLVIAALPFLLLSSFWSASQSINKPSTESLSGKDRVEIFESVWKTINDEYYDPAFNGVSWPDVRGRYRPLVDAAKSDDEFYIIIKQMLLELKDLHTGFVAPGDQSRSSGVSATEVEDRIVVVSVVPDSDAARAGVKAGMIVHSFDGKPIGARMAEVQTRLGRWNNSVAYNFVVFSSLLSGPLNTSFQLGLESSDGTRLEVKLKRHALADSPATLSVNRLPSGFGYLKIDRALRSPVDDQFESEFNNLKNLPGLIIDLRGISGGDIKSVGLKIANHFFSTKVSFGRFINRLGATPPSLSLSAGGGKQVYPGPVVILINESTRSAGEIFASGFQENGRAIIIGLRTCGCVLDRETRKVKGGGVLQYSHLGYVTGKGRKLEGMGIIPDKIVPLTISGLLQERDPMLEEAERSLKSKAFER